MLIDMGPMLRRAKRENFGIIATCPMSIEQVKWCYEAADRMNAPLILCSHASLQFNLPVPEIASAAKFYAEKFARIPSALCLDHSDSLEAAENAILAGFTGVMVDRSMCDLETNIRIVREAAKMSHAAGVAIEGAVGGVAWRDPTHDEIEAHLSKVEDVKRFVEETGADAVAVAVGSSHGDTKYNRGYSSETLLHYDLIRQLHACSEAALVIHGTSFTGDAKIAETAKCGMTKFNVGKDIMLGALKNLGLYCGGTEDALRTLDGMNSAIREGYIRRVCEYMQIVNSQNRI